MRFLITLFCNVFVILKCVTMSASDANGLMNEKPDGSYHTLGVSSDYQIPYKHQEDGLSYDKLEQAPYNKMSDYNQDRPNNKVDLSQSVETEGADFGVSTNSKQNCFLNRKQGLFTNNEQDGCNKKLKPLPSLIAEIKNLEETLHRVEQCVHELEDTLQNNEVNPSEINTEINNKLSSSSLCDLPLGHGCNVENTATHEPLIETATRERFRDSSFSLPQFMLTSNLGQESSKFHNPPMGLMDDEFHPSDVKLPFYGIFDKNVSVNKPEAEKPHFKFSGTSDNYLEPMHQTVFGESQGFFLIPANEGKKVMFQNALLGKNIENSADLENSAAFNVQHPNPYLEPAMLKKSIFGIKQDILKSLLTNTNDDAQRFQDHSADGDSKNIAGSHDELSGDGIRKNDSVVVDKHTYPDPYTNENIDSREPLTNPHIKHVKNSAITLGSLDDINKSSIENLSQSPYFVEGNQPFCGTPIVNSAKKRENNKPLEGDERKNFIKEKSGENSNLSLVGNTKVIGSFRKGVRKKHPLRESDKQVVSNEPAVPDRSKDSNLNTNEAFDKSNVKEMSRETLVSRKLDLTSARSLANKIAKSLRLFKTSDAETEEAFNEPTVEQLTSNEAVVTKEVALVDGECTQSSAESKVKSLRPKIPFKDSIVARKVAVIADQKSFRSSANNRVNSFRLSGDKKAFHGSHHNHAHHHKGYQKHSFNRNQLHRNGANLNNIGHWTCKAMKGSKRGSKHHHVPHLKLKIHEPHGKESNCSKSFA